MEVANILGGILWFALGFTAGVIYITENYDMDE
jgi:hypothetical protein